MLLNTPEWIDAGGPRGDGYVSYVSSGHVGPCAISYSGHRRHWAVFTSNSQAEAAASAACRWDIGGYGEVSIYPLIAVALDTQRYETAVDWLFGDVDPVDEKDRPRGVAYRARVAMRDMVRILAERPEELLKMEWPDLERALYEALLGLGYSVRHTRLTKDGGYDLEVKIEDKRYLIELKHWSPRDRVGPSAIRRFAEVVMREKASGGLFLASSGFAGTVAATRLEISQAPIRLGNDAKILSFCRSFLLSESGIWEPEGDLTEVFFRDTL